MTRTSFIATICAALWSTPLSADFVFNEDIVVDGRGCIGIECQSGDASGLVDLRLKSITPELHFEDTTNSTFATRDWSILKSADDLLITNELNSTAFTFQDDGAFRISAGTSQNGDLIILRVDTPSIRFENTGVNFLDGQIWDIGANEANFFVRDVDTNRLPLRIRPGAPTNAIYVDTNGQVGVGLQNPRGALHVRRNQPNNLPHLLLQNRREGGRTEIWFEDRDTATNDDALRLQLRGDDFNITFNGTGGAEFQVTKSGDVRIFRGDLVISNGGVIVGGSTLNVPDYVFADDYELMPLGDVAAFIGEHAHLPHIPSAAEVTENGLDVTAMQMAMLKTIEEQMLHILALEARLAALEAD